MVNDTRVEILEFLVKRRNNFEPPPTLAEISRVIGIMPNAIRNHLMTMEKHGWIVRGENKARAITVTEVGLQHAKGKVK